MQNDTRSRNSASARSNVRRRVNELAQAMTSRANRANHRGLRSLRRIGPGGRVRRRRDDRVGGLPDQRVHRALHQRSHRRMGAAEKTGIVCRLSWSNAFARRRDLDSLLSIGFRRSTSWRKGRLVRRSTASPSGSRLRAPTSSTPASDGMKRGCRPSRTQFRVRPGGLRRGG